MCGRTGMSWRRRSTPGSRTEPRGGDDRVCLRRGEGLRSFQGGRETSKTASWQPAKSRIRLLLKESDIPVAVNPKSADGPSNNPQCGFWDSQFSAAQVKSVEQPCGSHEAACYIPIHDPEPARDDRVTSIRAGICKVWSLPPSV